VEKIVLWIIFGALTLKLKKLKYKKKRVSLHAAHAQSAYVPAWFYRQYKARAAVLGAGRCLIRVWNKWLRHYLARLQRQASGLSRSIFCKKPRPPQNSLKTNCFNCSTQVIINNTHPKMALRVLTCAMEFSNPPKMALRWITRAQWNLVPTQRWRFAVLQYAMEFSNPRIAITLYFTHARDNRVSPMRAAARDNRISLRAERFYMALRCITRAQWNLVNHPRWRFAVLHVRNGI